MKSRKVFGIGFHKTGTTSLASALRKLGFSVARPDDIKDLDVSKGWEGLKGIVERFDAVQDNPWPLFYKELYRSFPEGRFILTVRPAADWIRSVVDHFGSMSTPLRESIYGFGHPRGNEIRYVERYERHNREVLEYFSDKAESLLVMDISAGDGWEELCRFLGSKRIPPRPFPHKRRGENRTLDETPPSVMELAQADASMPEAATKSASDGIVRESGTADHDAVLERDLAFHLGERETYAFDSLAEICRSTPPPDDAFLCFRAKPLELIAGDLYARLCKFGPEKVESVTKGLTGKHRRTIATINRDLADMHAGIAYALDFRDARELRYEQVFATEKPIPVFQYHRRRGLAAIVHPLQPRHQYPSRYIPHVGDRVRFREKRATIFWRGNLSGAVATPRGTLPVARVLYSRKIAEKDKTNYLRGSLRYSLSEKSQSCDVLDAGLTIKWRSGLFKEPVPFLSHLCRPTASIKEHLAHRYLLALDGYDGPSSHYWMLATNSLVLRQESNWEMFGDCYFLPWIHYVPIAADGSDLLDVFEWCERNSVRCEKIVANANRAWSVLFDERFQRERRRALFTRYAEWVGARL